MIASIPARSGLLERVFRSNPAYEFLPFRRFSESERELLGDLRHSVDVRGILRPRARSTLGVKTATGSLVALFRARRAPGRLPTWLTKGGPESMLEDEIARLVLDGVLEVERDGHFVSGAGADHLLRDSEQGEDRADPLESLSTAAVRYAAALSIDSPLSLASRIYFYNRIPVSPRWAHRLPTREAVLDFLGLAEGSSLRRLVDRHWTLTPADDLQDWASWKSRDRSRRRSEDAPTLKIYVSPMPVALRDAVGIVVRTLLQLEPTSFKTGGDINGLFRPDKFVIYFEDETELREVAEHLTRSLDGMLAHGVPFTASVNETGILSRGLDPPRTARVLESDGPESWRVWVTNRLAVNLLTARATRTTHTEMTDDQFAIARLRLDGVDTRQWTPGGIEWAQHAHRFLEA
jgi:hypothetical protein